MPSLREVSIFGLIGFKKYNVTYNGPSEKSGEKYLTFLDNDGLKFEMIESPQVDTRIPWTTDTITQENGIRGFYNITLTLQDIKGTAHMLTSIFGYKLTHNEGNKFRYTTDTVEQAAIIDLVQLPNEKNGHVANGTVHHVAFRVKNDEILMYFREKIKAIGLNITPQIDRNYFHSAYFREPGGVLFELATENPGFTVDEPLDALGTSLKLPEQYESSRKELEKTFSTDQLENGL